ncbi:hypothetical protein ACRB68_61970 [Actinomadura sp. RB68]|uniref:DUF6817 domain-containing protein n=1 Tax=Actinomadura macrotermitis TaxID=2585200 RepID=A0A7K0C3S6_9ACTN|nr:hypothetical protein [Actinomadura macrotermitis]
MIEFLTKCGAAEIDHPGGTLLAHLQRVHAVLARWGARPAVQSAGLCHAYYGTDGFPVALGEVSRRDDLANVIGDEAEQIVYFYASCDRAFSYPRLANGGEFRDRFNGTTSVPPESGLRDFAEITVANELDVLAENADLRARYGPKLLALFASWQHLLSPAAREAVARS